MAATFPPLPAPAPRASAKNTTQTHPPEEEHSDDGDSCLEAHTTRSTSSSSGSSTSSSSGSSTTLTSSSEDATSETSFDDSGNAALQPNSGAELEAVGGVGEAHQELQALAQAPLPENDQPHSGGEAAKVCLSGDFTTSYNHGDGKVAVSEEFKLKELQGLAVTFLEDNAALDKILEESENLSQLTSESDLDDWAAEHAAAALPQLVSYPRPTVISSFTTTSSASMSTRPSIMSLSQELNFAGSTTSVSTAAAAGQYSGTEIGWARDGRPPLLQVAGARTAAAVVAPPDFRIASGVAPRRNLRHSGPMPPPSRPLYSPASSPSHVKSSTKSKSEHPFPGTAAAASAAPEYGRSPSPANSFFTATPSPGRSFYQTGLVSPARTYNPTDFASRAFGHQVFGNKGGSKSEQGKSQLANLEEELSTLLRNRASNRRAANSYATVTTRLPLPPAGRRGFSMELQRGSHPTTPFVGAPSSNSTRPVEPVYSDDDDDEEDEDGDAIYEESMRELEILVRAGSRFNHISSSTKPPEPAPVLTRPERRDAREQGGPVEKQIVHVEPPKTKLSWGAVSKSGILSSDVDTAYAQDPLLGPVSGESGLDKAGTQVLASSEESVSANGGILPRKSPTVHVSQRGHKKVLKPLGEDFSLGNASSQSSEDRTPCHLPALGPANDDTFHAASMLRSLSKDVQSLVSRVSWSSRKELKKSRSLDDSVLPDKARPFVEETSAAEIAKGNFVELLRQDSNESSLRMLSMPDSRESSSRKLSRQDSKDSSSRRLSRQESRERCMRKLEAGPSASYRKSEVDGANSSPPGKAGLDSNSPSFKTLTTSVPQPETSRGPNDEARELDVTVLNSLENVAVVRLRGSRCYYGSFAASEADGPHIDLTASPAAKFLDDSTIPDDFSQPFRTSAAVPFKWEEAPGKPKSPTISGKKAYALQPPPRLQLVSGPLPSHAGATRSPGLKPSHQTRFSGPQDTDCRSPPRQPDQSSGANISILASPGKLNLGAGISPKRHSVKNVGTPSPESKKGMSRLQNLLHGGCTLADVAHLSHALRLPVPPSKDDITRLSRNIDLLVSVTDRDRDLSSSSDLLTASSPNSVLCRPPEMGSSSGSLSSSQRGKEDSPEQLGSFQCFSLPAAQRGPGAPELILRQHSMKRNRSVRDATANLQASSTEDGSRSKHHSGQHLGSLFNADISKTGSSRTASGRSSRRVPVSSGRVSLGKFPSLKALDCPGSGSEWEEVAHKSPGSPRPLAKRSKSDSSRALVRVRRFPRFMITLKRVVRRAFCFGPKSRLGNSQRYTSTSSPMYAITLN